MRTGSARVLTAYTNTRNRVGAVRPGRQPKPPLCKGRWLAEGETEGLFADCSNMQRGAHRTAEGVPHHTAYADTRGWVGAMHPHTRTYSF